MPSIKKTYVVGSQKQIRRRDDHTGGWVDITPNVDPDTRWYDVMSHSSNPNHVIAVGDFSSPTGFLTSGIIVSFDAGATWQSPGGNWKTSKTYHDVWIVDDAIGTPTVWVAGENGKIFRSTDGGLNFGACNQFGLGANGQSLGPTPGDIIWTTSLHGINQLVCVVVGYERASLQAATPFESFGADRVYVWRTQDGGNNWTQLNQGATTPNNTLVNTLSSFDIGFAHGVWISPDQSKIIVSSLYNQHVSTDSGLTFTAVLPETERSCRHMTWYPDHDAAPSRFRRSGGLGNTMIIESLDVGASWTITRPGLIGPDVIHGIHFYSPQNGYYVQRDQDIYQTQNGGVTGLVNYTETVVQNVEWTAIHTSEYDQDVYELIDCTGQQPTQYATDPNLGNYVGQVIIIPSFVIGDLQEGCFQVELYSGPVTGTYDQPVPIQDGPFPDCVTCDPTYYELTDCEGNEAPIYTTNGLIQYANAPLNLNKSVAPYLTLTPCCGGAILQSVIIQPITCTTWEIFLATDTPAGTVQYTDCDGNYQQIPYPFIDGPTYGQGLTLTVCSQYQPSISSSGALPTAIGDCSPPPPPPVPNWLSDLTNVADVIIYNGECYSTSFSPGPVVPTQPAGFISNPTDAQVTLLNAADCAQAAIEDATCVCDNPQPAFNPGIVVQIEECPNVCWEINEIPPDTTLELSEVTVTAEYIDCEDCLPDEPQPELIIRNRTVRPGYDVPGICDAEYHDKISCKFIEAVYQRMASKRFGIEFCCDKEEDLERYEIKFEMLKLAVITDPNACRPISLAPEDCCPPCNVVAILEIFDGVPCPEPENVDAFLILPWPICPEPDTVNAIIELDPIPPLPCPPPEQVDATLSIDTPVVECNAYEIIIPVDAKEGTLEYVDCDGNPVALPTAATTVEYVFQVCSQTLPTHDQGATINQIGTCDTTGIPEECFQVEYRLTFPATPFSIGFSYETCQGALAGAGPVGGGILIVCGNAAVLPNVPGTVGIAVVGLC